MIICSKSGDAKNSIYLWGEHCSPQCWISRSCALRFWLVFHLKGGIWDYSLVIHPDGGSVTYPGLTHSALLGCATSVKGKALDTLPRWATYHLPLCTCSLSFPTTFCFLLAQLAQAWPCPALARFRCVLASVVEGTSPVQSDLPWPHQLAAPEHGDYRVSHHSRSLKMEKITFSPSFLLVLHLFFLEFL